MDASAKRYPGRDLVMSRQDAADIRYRQLRPEDFSGTRERFECERPYIIHALGLPSRVETINAQWQPGKWPGKVPVEVGNRCRRCDNCLKHRRRLWTARAIDELKASNRTWFGTLTVAPHERFKAQVYASQRATRRGHGNWHSMTAPDQYEHLHSVLSPEVTKWLKRVRKAAAAPLRYLLVSEAHRDGFPHFHLLLHEPALPVTKRVLESNWRLGFSQFRLVQEQDPRSAYYACKYLAKEARTRVRASLHYGRGQFVARSTERMQAVTRAMRGSPPPVAGSPVETG